MEKSTDTVSHLQSNSQSQSSHWLDLAEIVSVIFAVGGSVASIFLEQVAVATIPLSASVTLNLLNRKRLIELGDQENHSKLVQLAQYSKMKLETVSEKVEEFEQTTFPQMAAKNQADFEALSAQFKAMQEATLSQLTEQTQENKAQIDEIQQLTIAELVERSKLINTSQENRLNIDELSSQLEEIQQLTIAELIEQTKTHQTHLSDLSQKLQEVQQTALSELSTQSQRHQANLEKLSGKVTEVQALTTSLQEETEGLQEYTKTIDSKQEEISQVVDCLKEIESKTKAVKSNTASPDEAHFDLGLNHERLGDYGNAIVDYTEAIRLNPYHAKAHYHRGVLRHKQGEKQEAVDDLRNAAKYFFEEGDMARYEKARDLSKQIHQISHELDTSKPGVSVGGLFE